MQLITNLPSKLKKIIYSILANREIHYIGGSTSLPPPLEKEEEEKCSF